MKTRVLVPGVPLLVAFATACTDGTTGSVRFAISSQKPPAAAFGAAVSGAPLACTPVVTASGGQTVITCGTDVLTLSKVSVVLREIELERVEVDECDEITGNDDCEEFETGVVRFDLPLGTTSTEHVLTLTGVPPGMYDELEFEIHKPDAATDATFIQANPDLAGASIRVEGTFSQGGGPAASFVFTSDLNEEQEQMVSLTVPEGGTVGVTLRLDVSSWFLVEGSLVNPETANKGQPNENAVRDNIRTSIETLHDDDEDGMDDDHEGS